jgi:ethanolamine utilization protein EutM
MSMPPSTAGAKKMNGNALGLIETLGLVGLITAVDAMLKAASVEVDGSVINLDR